MALFLFSNNHMADLPKGEKEELKCLDRYQFQAGVYENKDGKKRHIAMVIVPFGAVYYATETGKRFTDPKDGATHEAYDSPNSRGVRTQIHYMDLSATGKPGKMALCSPSEFAKWLALEPLADLPFPFTTMKVHGPGYRETLAPIDREAALKASRDVKKEDIMKDLKEARAADEKEAGGAGASQGATG